MPPEPSTSPVESRSRWLAAAEVALIFLLFFLYAGWPPPDVNEAHYLAKAKHFWNPEWCPGDPFLESADAHAVFVYTFGWLTRFCSLPATAWIGRLITWVLMAVGWRRMSFAAVPRPFFSILTAGLFLCFLSRGHMAGEWVVGGVEAKGFAFALVFFALAELCYGRWGLCFVLLGAASAFHVLVGGWSVIAVGVVWLLSPSEWPRLKQLLPCLLLGGALSLPGLIPVLTLNRGTDPAIVDMAAQIYVFERLDHHLLVQSFQPWFVVRFIDMTVLWLALCLLIPADTAARRLRRFVGAALVIALAGANIEIFTASNPTIAAGWMRFYWYRLADAAVPLGLAMTIVGGIIHVQRRSRPIWGWLLLSVAILVPAASLVEQACSNWLYRTGDPEHVTLHAKHRDWQEACRWIDANTPPDERFLTPRHQQTFKWYAGRSEVFNWKDIPQNAEQILDWQQRRLDIFQFPSGRPGRRWRSSITEIDLPTLLELAKKYGFRYIVIDQPMGDAFEGHPFISTVFQNDSITVVRLKVVGE